ncbi:Hypothetical protein D9617_2g058070 [Elsinoe fawcettii]|nr:Hypothetical protein D9617_2g058070 [Elsinoe fawcettii]
MASQSNSPRPRSGTASSIQSATRSVRAASNRMMDSNVPLGFMAATAAATSMAPTISDIRRGSFGSDGWDSKAQKEHSNEQDSQQQTAPGRRPSSTLLGRFSYKGAGSPTVPEERDAAPDGSAEPFPDMTTAEKQTIQAEDDTTRSIPTTSSSTQARRKSVSEEISPVESHSPSMMPQPLQARKNTIPNGFIEPPKVPWTKSTAIALKAFWKWFITPFGFLVTIYGLNVVAWGGMLFLILLNAAPAMCSQNSPENQFNGCNDINSPRRIWIEITSQILNGLFCVTGFGLIPWRFRDLYFNLRWRLLKEEHYLRRLAGINSGWFRLPGSDTLDELSSTAYLSSLSPDAKNRHTDIELGVETGAAAEASDPRLPLPLSKTPQPPLTGVRAQPTRLWLLDFVIWCNVWNTFFQACLCGFMWGLNRYDRPSWSTGLFVALACGIAGVGGVTMFVQGKRVKRVEGVRPDGGTGNGEAIGTKGEDEGKWDDVGRARKEVALGV